MTKTFRKLIGLMLCVCLLLPYLPALAASGNERECVIIVAPSTDKEFSGMSFNLYQIAEPGTSATNWTACDSFKSTTVAGVFNESFDTGNDFAKRIIEKMAEVTSMPKVDSVTVDDKNQLNVSLVPGIYYGTRVAGTGSSLIEVMPFVFSISPLKSDEPITIDVPDNKVTRTTNSHTTVSVSKTWDDKEFLDYRPKDGITVILFQKDSKGNLKQFRENIPLSEKEGQNEIAVWKDLDVFDDYGKAYKYSVSEATVNGYNHEITKLDLHVSLDEAKVKSEGYEDITVELLEDDKTKGEARSLNQTYSTEWELKKEDGYDLENHAYTVRASAKGLDDFRLKELNAALNVSYSFSLVNTLKDELEPEYGSLKIIKQFEFNGTTPAPDSSNWNLIKGKTFHFKIEGPTNRKGMTTNYLEGKVYDPVLDITVPGDYDGTKELSATYPHLITGDYTITEVTEGDDWPEGMEAKVKSITLTVEKDKTATPTTEQIFVNNQTTGNLKLTKTIVLEDDNSKAPSNGVVKAKFNFIITGPLPDNTVRRASVEIGNLPVGTVDVPGPLLPGTYRVEEEGVTDQPATKQWQKFIMPAPTTVVVEAGADKTVTHTVVNQLVTTPTPTPKPTPTPTPTRSNTTGGGGGGGGNNRTNPPSNNTTPPPGETTPPPGETTPPPSTEPPEETPTPTPTPEPTPTPTPVTNVTIRKVWDDDSNTHRTRPASITVQLLRNGEQINMASMTGTGDNWSFTFSNLPAVDQNGTPYNYLARELSVNGYTTELNGTTITNHLIRKPPERYISISGIKIWRDMDNASGQRPNQIVVRLMRDGVEVERRTVTSLQNWQFSFNNIPEDDGFGNKYTYTIQEEAVNGYFARFEGSTITNSRLPERPYMPPATGEEIDYETFRDTGTPLAGFPMGEGDLEELLTLYDYPMPLWGEPMKTGDEMPIYPIIFGSVGLCALVAVIVLSNMEKKKKRKGA